MKFDQMECKASSVLLIITNVLPMEDIGGIDGNLKDYQKHGFRLDVEFAEFVQKYRVHFYHFSQETMNSFLLRDKILQRLAESVKGIDTKEKVRTKGKTKKEEILNEKVLIVIDKEIFNWFTDLAGDKFESEILACLPQDHSPVMLDMAREKKEVEIHELYYFTPDGNDKQGGRITEFTAVQFEGKASEN